jgi:predicted nucleic acid-binding protein
MANLTTIFVDTPVLLCADDVANAERRDRARSWLSALWQQRRGRTSTQVLNEYYVQATRHFTPGLPQGDARAKLRRLQQWKPWQIDHQTVESAWGFEARFGLAYWDALIVAAASQSGCAYVLTESLPHGEQYDAVRAVNPFITEIAELA